MPVLLAPLVVWAVILLSFVALYIYEQLFGSPLEGLARSVPVVGGYLARGVKAAVSYGKATLTKYTLGPLDKLVDWFMGLAASVGNFVAAVNAFMVELPSMLDHLTHVTVHNIVKAFVDPVRATANEAEKDATSALHGIDVVERELEAKFVGIEGSVRSSIDHAVNVIRNVDLPDLEHVLEGKIGDVANTAAGDVQQVSDWAGGWIDYLLDQLQRLPIEQLLEGLAAVAGTAAIVRVIEQEAGLDNPQCRAKVKAICQTDPAAWLKLLAGVVALFAFPGLQAIVETAQKTVGLLDPVVREIGGMR